jgi:hypothetical protein
VLRGRLGAKVLAAVYTGRGGHGKPVELHYISRYGAAAGFLR